MAKATENVSEFSAIESENLSQYLIDPPRTAGDTVPRMSASAQNPENIVDSASADRGGYAGLYRSAYQALDLSGALPAAAVASVIAHLALVVAPLIFAGAFDSASRRELRLSATTATSRSFDVSLKRPAPPVAPQPDASNKSTPAEGANVKHVSRFNSDVLQQHTNSIWNSIVYPHAARRMGWQGRVSVRVVVAPDGTVVDASILQTSGYGVLDDAALNGVRSHQFTAGDATEVVTIALRFKLTDQK